MVIISEANDYHYSYDDHKNVILVVCVQFEKPPTHNYKSC